MFNKRKRLEQVEEIPKAELQEMQIGQDPALDLPELPKGDPPITFGNDNAVIFNGILELIEAVQDNTEAQRTLILDLNKEIRLLHDTIKKMG